MKRSNTFSTIPAMLLGIVLGILAGVCSMPAFAVDTNGAFELDGNADQDATPPPDDWETLVGIGGDETTIREELEGLGMPIKNLVEDDFELD
jgi:hypothetical protein